MYILFVAESDYLYITDTTQQPANKMSADDVYVYVADQTIKATRGDDKSKTDDVDYSFAPELPANTAVKLTDDCGRSGDVNNAVESSKQQICHIMDPDNAYDFETPVHDGDSNAQAENGLFLNVKVDGGMETLVMQENDVYEASNITTDANDVCTDVDMKDDSPPIGTTVLKVNDDVTALDDVIFVENNVYE